MIVSNQITQMENAHDSALAYNRLKHLGPSSHTLIMSLTFHVNQHTKYPLSRCLSIIIRWHINCLV